MLRKDFLFIFVLLLAMFAASCSQPLIPTIKGTEGSSKVLLGEGKQIVAYFTDWSTNHSAMGKYKVSKVPFDKLTIINFAFTSITDDVHYQFTDFKNYTQTKFGRTVGKYEVAWLDKDADVDQTFQDPTIEWGGEYTGVLGQLKYYKEQYPHIKVVFSVGGWTKGHMFSEMAASDTARATFVQSCVTFAREYGLDGVDIDWEYPGINRPRDGSNMYDWGCPGNPEIDGDNFTKLLRDLKTAFNAAGTEDGKEYLVTAAVGIGYDKVVFTTPADYIPHLDYLNLMTYDMHGAWDAYTGHQAPMKAYLNGPFNADQNAKYNIEFAVQNFTNLGVPKAKMNLGLPYYSRGWTGVEVGPDTSQPGLYQSATGGAPGKWEAGGYNPYFHMKHLIATTSLTSYYDPVAKASFAYDSTKKEWYTYDSLAVIQEKANYIMNEGLAGGMIWEIDGDTWTDGSYELTNALYNILYPQGAVVPTPVPPTPTPTLAPGEYRDWSSRVKFIKYTVVRHNGSLWKCQWDTKNDEPGSNMATWFVWQPYEESNSGSTSTDTNTTTPSTATNTPTPTPNTNNTNTNSGDTAPAWAAGTTYTTNELVTYGGSVYKCLATHPAITGWEPPNVASLWTQQ